MSNKIRLNWILLVLTTCGSIKPNAAAPSSCGPESRCTLISYCSVTNVNAYGRNLITFRSSEANPCANYLQVCCKKEDIREPAPLPPAKSDCGLRNIEGKLIQVDNGVDRETDFPEFPWVVAIFLNSDSENKFIGGGSIVAPNVVLTAAHTVFSQRTEELVVRAGEWDTQTEDEPLKHHNCLVSETITHEQFEKSTGIYDIALLLLKEPLELTHHIRPICLPRSYEFLDVQRCLVAGWGQPKFYENSEPRNIMRKVDLPILNDTECEQKFRQTRLGRYFELNESLLCAGGEKDMDACTGDGGSPLFCPLLDHPNQYFQLGIVAWGLGCHTENVPGAYANVFKMQVWLRDNLKELNVNPNYYTPSFTMEYYKREINLKSKQ